MADTFVLIEAQTIGSGGAASVTLGSGETIPQTYTDLLLVSSIRASSGGTISAGLRFNSTTSTYAEVLFYGTGTSVSSTNATVSTIQWASEGNSATALASSFSSNEIYIPKYTTATYKGIFTNGMTENNTTAADIYIDAGVWSNTAPVTSINIIPSSSTFAQFSTFYLYGIKNS
jgi:hypothetical protein